ncbi:MAG: hypothetical protein Q4Q04_06420 [Methanocorpusculum sp.]|nr:hypothetical protein [Methanocorpusculum sp.]
MSTDTASPKQNDELSQLREEIENLGTQISRLENQIQSLKNECMECLKEYAKMNRI